MKHLEMRRDATERRPVALMSHGLARFLKSKSYIGVEDMNDLKHKAGASYGKEHILSKK